MNPKGFPRITTTTKASHRQLRVELCDSWAFSSGASKTQFSTRAHASQWSSKGGIAETFDYCWQSAAPLANNDSHVVEQSWGARRMSVHPNAVLSSTKTPSSPSRIPKPTHFGSQLPWAVQRRLRKW